MRIRPIALCAALLLLCLSAAFAGCKGEEERSLYAIDAVYEDGTLKAALDLDFYNDTENELTVLDFNLFGNAYREGARYAPVSAQFAASAYYGGPSYGGMEIVSVSPCKGWEIAGEDENILRVTLGESVFPAERTALCIEYELRLASVNHRTGITEGGVVNLGNFYPVLCVYEEGKGFAECPYYSNGDPFYTACADYDVTFAADAGLTVAASGKQVSQTVAGGMRTLRFALQNARDFAIALGDLNVAQTTAGGVTVRYYYRDDAQAQAMLGTLAESLAYFSDTFGAYPYETYSAVQTGFCYGGMEYPGLVYLSDALSRDDLLYTAVHETAHQWWYAAVGNNECEYAFLDEGLAEYSCYLFFSEYDGYGISAVDRLKMAHSACNALVSVQEKVFGEADTSMNRPLSEYGAYEYVVIAYDKGMLLFDALRDAVGERAFFSSLKRYYKQNEGKIATPATLAAAFKNAGASGVIASFMDGSAIV